MKNLFVLAIVILAGVAVLFALGRDDAPSVNPALAQEFSVHILGGVHERVGQPIEGVDAFIARRAFGGFVAEDFEGVEAREGVYRVRDGEVAFERTVRRPVTSAEQAISEEGWATLLGNVAARLGVTVETGDDVLEIIRQLNTDPVPIVREIFSQNGETWERFTHNTHGFSIGYRTEPDGYVAIEGAEESVDASFILTLFDRGEYDEFQDVEEAREGPPAISVTVFRNTEGIALRDWVEDDFRSNYRVEFGEIIATELGGRNALSYPADGLYASDVVVVEHGGAILFFSVAYITADDEGREDFQEFLDTVRFTQPSRQKPPIATKDVTDLIRGVNIERDQEIKSPLTVTGEARGFWFFEASAPVTLVDWDGRIIAESFVTAQGEWMTENFVSFSGAIEFETPEFGETGALILANDNPSGLLENDRAIEIPIRFKQK